MFIYLNNTKLNRYLSIAVKLLVVGFLSSATKTKTMLISPWKEKSEFVTKLFLD